MLGTHHGEAELASSTECGPQQDSKGHSHRGGRAICPTVETLQQLEARALAGAFDDTLSRSRLYIHECFDSENRKHTLYLHSRVQTTVGSRPGSSVFMCVK